MGRMYSASQSSESLVAGTRYLGCEGLTESSGVIRLFARKGKQILRIHASEANSC